MFCEGSKGLGRKIGEIRLKNGPLERSQSVEKYGVETFLIKCIEYSENSFCGF
jgi:hypothetical protein